MVETDIKEFQDFLEGVAEVELQSAQLMANLSQRQQNKKKTSKPFLPQMNQLSDGMGQCYQNRALQAWEFSENIQKDCVDPLKEVQESTLMTMEQLKKEFSQLETAMTDKRQEVSRYERDYIHDAKLVNESHQQCLSFE